MYETFTQSQLLGPFQQSLEKHGAFPITVGKAPEVAIDLCKSTKDKNKNFLKIAISLRITVLKMF